MDKPCEICGRIISVDDWYAFIKTKYCKKCAAAEKRRRNAERMRELRKKTREENAIARQLCKQQQAQIDKLLDVVQQQRERLRELERECGK